MGEDEQTGRETGSEKAMKMEQKIFLVAQRDTNVNEPSKEDLYDYGCIGEIKQVIKLPKNILRILVIGRERSRIIDLDTSKDYLESKVEVVKDYYEGTFDSYDMEQGIEEIDEEIKEDRDGYDKINGEAKIRELKEIYASYVSTLPNQKKSSVCKP